MREHKMTISSVYRPGWHALKLYGQVPYLAFTGKWLEDAGFWGGARVLVSVEGDGRLVVVRVDAEG